MKRIFASATGALGTIASYKYVSQRIQNRNHETIKAKAEQQPVYEWDFNWDFRHPQPDWTDDMKAKYTYVYRIAS